MRRAVATIALSNLAATAMPIEATIEMVPRRVAAASHCGPLIRPRFHSVFSASPQPRARSTRQAGDWKRTMSTDRPVRRLEDGMETESRQGDHHRKNDGAVTCPHPGLDAANTAPAVEVVVPVYNEERALDENIRRLHAYLHDWFPLPTRITIADNASTDGTWRVATALAEDLPDVRAIHLDVKGRGRALTDRLVAQRRGRGRVHGRRSLHRAVGAPPPRGAPALGSQRRGHREPAAPRVAGGARAQAGDDLPLLQPHPQGRPRGGVLRRAVRLQGRPRGSGARAASPDRGQRLVLRHRTPRSGRTRRPAHPRGPCRLGRRPGFPRRHRAAPRSPTSRACSACVRSGWTRRRTLHVPIDPSGVARVRRETPMRSSTTGTGLDTGIGTGDRWRRGAVGAHGRAGSRRASLRARARRLVRGAEADPPWARPAFLALLVLTGRLYIWGLGRLGLGELLLRRRRPGGHAELEGLLLRLLRFFELHHRRQDPGGAVGHGHLRPGVRPELVEPAGPAGAWRAWPRSAVLYAAVRRWWGPAAGLIAGVAVAATPVAALMFRYDNPDALLTLLLVSAAYATLRAVEDGRTRWLLLAGTFVGFGFLTKMLQAFIVLPVFALAYLIAGRPRLLRRLGQLVLALCGGRRVGRLVGGHRRAPPRLGPTVHRRDRPPTASCSSPSATTAWAASPATRSGRWAAARTATRAPASAAPRASPGCSRE